MDKASVDFLFNARLRSSATSDKGKADKERVQWNTMVRFYRPSTAWSTDTITRLCVRSQMCADSGSTAVKKMAKLVRLHTVCGALRHVIPLLILSY